MSRARSSAVRNRDVLDELSQTVNVSLVEHSKASALKLRGLEAGNARLYRRLLGVMRRVELLRCRNVPTTVGEADFIGRMVNLGERVRSIGAGLDSVRNSVDLCRDGRIGDSGAGDVNVNGDEGIASIIDGAQATRIRAVLDEQAAGVDALTEIVRKDRRDVAIVVANGGGGGIAKVATSGGNLGRGGASYSMI